MSVQARQNIDTRPFALYTHPAFRKDDSVIEQDAARAADLVQYTLMGKKVATVPAVGTADVGNAGNGTVTAVAVAAGGSPIVGTYELENVLVVAEGGVFKLTDPNGNVVDGNLVLNVGALGVTVFTVGGMTFTVTDGAIDFGLADLFTIAVTANGKYVPFDPAAVDGAQIPSGIYMADDIPFADLVAGDYVDAPIVFTGMNFDEDKLVFDDGVSTLATLLASGKTVRDTLNDQTLIAQKTRTTSLPENA